MKRALILLTTIAAAFQAPAPKLDDGRAFLQLPQDQSPIQQAAYAVATNQPTAEQQLRAILRAAPKAPEANQAHLLLSHLYMRTARYRSVLANFDQWRKNFPGSADLREQQEDVEQFRGLPDQTNTMPRSVTLRHDSDLAFPISINGKEATYLFDTGASVSVMGESEARRLGLKLRDTTIRMGDSSGIGFNARVAIAGELRIGDTRFRNVSFIVPPNSSDGAPYGIIGLPVILGMHSMRWNKSGTVDLAVPDDTGVDRNMVFYGLKPLARATVDGQPVWFTLDSGAVDTDLNSRFADQFPSRMARATAKEGEITGLGGTAKFEARVLDDLPLLLNGRPVSLKPARVTMQLNSGLGGECCIGNMGDDILLSHPGFFLDFTHMTLRLF